MIVQREGVANVPLGSILLAGAGRRFALVGVLEIARDDEGIAMLAGCLAPGGEVRHVIGFDPGFVLAVAQLAVALDRFGFMRQIESAVLPIIACRACLSTVH